MAIWKISFILVFIPFVLMGCSTGEEHSNVTTSTTNSSHSEEVKEGYVRITIVKGGSEYLTEEEISIEEEDNLFQVMKNNFFIEESSGNITSIERVKANEEDNTEWTYTVNGIQSEVKASEYVLSSGDKIIFDLQTIE